MIRPSGPRNTPGCSHGLWPPRTGPIWRRPAPGSRPTPSPAARPSPTPAASAGAWCFTAAPPPPTAPPPPPPRPPPPAPPPPPQPPPVPSPAALRGPVLHLLERPSLRHGSGPVSRKGGPTDVGEGGIASSRLLEDLFGDEVDHAHF